MTILRIDSSAKTEGSTTSALLDRIEEQVGRADIRRDIGGTALPHLSGTWLAANFTPEDQRTDEARAALALSDTLIDELRAADTILIGVPIYNFSIPSSLKSWIDLVCRAGVTFRYTEDGPIGLLEGKRAILAVASGGTPVGSDIDWASGYMRHIMGFIGITDVTVISADQLMARGDEAVAQADAQIAAIAA
ncbi:FMN-dependent NADH-azoreductase [Jannaschia seosinensis]|uniref:FMN dependent NADH:quinone oxidoreductase n=2 Tax=Jannaschia seosinensis TaxID=313367 RepID=A0A0M7BCL6_9RHOB|nr:FMN-dependent NADH-azoreductase [Jannaschia seosinensis]